MIFCISHFRSDRKSFKVCENQRQKSEREKFSSKNPPRLDSLLLSHKSIMSLERRWFYPPQPVAYKMITTYFFTEIYNNVNHSQHT